MTEFKPQDHGISGISPKEECPHALDAYGLDRNVVLGIENPLYFDATRVPTDYVILGRLGLAQKLDQRFDAERIAVYGDADNEFACYAEVFRSRNAGNTTAKE